MPIYEYECTQCGKVEEALQNFSDDPLTQCKHCSGTLHKLISQSSFHLKGSGWYVTDYANKSRGDSSPADGGKTESKTDSSKSDAGSSKKSESSTPSSDASGTSSS